MCAMAEKDRTLENLVSMPLWDAVAERDGSDAVPVVREDLPVEAGARRIGLFVDAENVRLGMLGETIKGMLKEGEVRIRRAFGHWPGVLAGSVVGDEC